MSLVTPLALAWAALTIPIVIFYILKVRLRQVPVSTTIFWRQIYDEKTPRSLWQQLRHWLSLLVQLIWLLLLVLALAEPFFASELLIARRTILIIDNSASMNATDVAPTRLVAAQRAARQHAASLRFRDEMAVISAGTQPQVVCGLTGHERTLQHAIDGIAASDGPTRVPEAVALAKRLLADARQGQIIVYSDGGFVGAEQLVQDEMVRIQPIGTVAANVGITRFQVRRSEVDPLGYEILVEVQNASSEPSERRLNLDLNDVPVDVIPLKLAPGEVWSQTFEKTSITGGTLVAKLDGSDVLTSDDAASALLPQRESLRVLLVSPGNLFLQKALAAIPLVELKTTKELPKSYEPGVIHVFHRLVPEQLPAGRSFVVDPLTGSDLWKTGEPLESPIVTKQDAESPLMRHVRLDNVILPQARQLEPIGKSQVLAGAVSGDPLYFVSEEPSRRVLVLTVNLDQGDLTFRTAFPILITNALAWFAGQAGTLQESLEAGALQEINITAAVDPQAKLLVRSPSGKDRLLPPVTTKVSIGPLDEVGIWQVGTLKADESSAEFQPLQALACNLGSKPESDLRLPESWSDRSLDLAGTLGFVRPIWFYLVALGCFLAVIEWFLYQRRWIS